MDNFNGTNNFEQHNNSYEKKYKKTRLLNIILVSVLVGILIGGGLIVGFINMSEVDSKNLVEAASDDDNNFVNNSTNGDNEQWYTSPVVNVAEEVLPSIVMIKNKVNVNTGFEFQMVDKGSGSGIIYREDGYIITNQHVIDNASEIVVTLHDGTEYEGRVLGQDTKTDLAVIKIEANNLPAGKFGDSTKLKVGELAVAIGNPVGVEFSGTVTAGIISALDRSLSVGETEMKLIQTDAAINPGNSGGALVNERGEIIGINSVKLASSEIEGMGFAIPINDALPIINELMQNGYIKRPWIGVGITNVTEQASEKYNLPIGVYVAKVYFNSPAEEAGFMVNDVITAIDGEKVETVEQLSDKVAEFEPGDVIKVTLYRNNEKKDVNVTLGVMPPTE